MNKQCLNFSCFVIAIIFFQFCSPSLERSQLEFLSLFRFSGSSSFTLVYAGSPFTFTLGLAISEVVPESSAQIRSCTISPNLPNGLLFDDSTCAISGTPNTQQPATEYTITAFSLASSRQTKITIAITSSSPTNLVYTNSPFSFIQNVAITNQTPTLTGTANSCNASPSLPSGLNLSSTCVLSGTPTGIQVATNYTITATNPFGSTNTTISIAVTSAIYRFEFSSGSLTEIGGSGLTFTPVGALTQVNGKDGDSNGAYLFLGSEYLTISNPSGMPMGASDRTYCAWVNPTATPNQSVILSQGTATADNAMGITLNSTYPLTDVSFWSFGSAVTVAYTPRVNSWQHICGTLNGTTATIYVDGRQIGSGTLNNVNTTAAVLNVGANINFNDRFSGKIDDVRVYRLALSASQIRNISLQVPSNLLARYDFTGDPSDTSGNNNSLSAVGSPALVPDRNGMAASAYRFNGSTRFTTSTPVTTSIVGNVTLSAWIRPTGYNAG